MAGNVHPVDLTEQSKHPKNSNKPARKKFSYKYEYRIECFVGINGKNDSSNFFYQLKDNKFYMAGCSCICS